MKTVICQLKKLFFISCLVLIVNSCRKAETEIVSKQYTETKTRTDKAVKQFFTLPNSIEPTIKKVADQISRDNIRSGFLENFIKTRGFALWDKAMVKTTKTKGATLQPARIMRC